MLDGKDLLAEMNAIKSLPQTDLRSAIRAQSFRQTCGQPMTLRRAQAFAAMLDALTPFVYECDYLVGSLRSSFGVADEETQQTEPQDPTIINERNFSTHFDHIIVDYPRLMRLGFTGIRQEIAHRLQSDSELGDQERAELTAMAISTEAAIGYLGRYAQVCDRKASMAPGTGGTRWQEVATVCRNLTHHPPGSFHEAVQLTWFAHHLLCLEGRYANGLGRLDQYLAPFYNNDVATERLSADQASLLLTHLWAKIGEYRVVFGPDDVVNIAIGGTTPTGTDGTNELSYLCLAATRALQIPGPNLSARIHPSTPDRFYRECVDTIATGVGYPALFNDAVLIPALQAIGIPTVDARDYALVGCIETFLPGKQPPWSDSRFNLPKCLELTLGNGRDLRTGELLGLETGLPQEFASFEQLLTALETQIRYAAHHHAEYFRTVNRDVSPHEYTSPFLSSLMTDCILRGRDLNDGGTRFPSNHGIAAMGLGTVVDSLAAIRHCVFEEQRFSMETICQALQANFAGYEELQKRLWHRAPKYGNDDEAVDHLAVWVVDTITSVILAEHTFDGGRFLPLMAANISNISAGHETAATPDGRGAGEPFSDAASPTYGQDRSGPTAVIRSATRPNWVKVTGGSVFNQKYHPSALSPGIDRSRLVNLLQVFFALGGQEIQLNVVSPEQLQAAMLQPEQYADLVVRVSGFSARFVTLDPEVQADIIARTTHQRM